MEGTGYFTTEEIYGLFSEYGTPERVIRHCEEVCRTALLIAGKLNENGAELDIPLIRSAALCHDLLRTTDEHDKAAGELLESMGHHKEAELVKDHMSYMFNDLPLVTEHDVLCLSDRIVKEDCYVGIDERVDYLVNKYPENADRKDHLLKWRNNIRDYIRGIEEMISCPLDSLIGSGIDELLKEVERPGRYIGGEINEIRKPHSEVSVRMAFAFPDLYEIGMSYLGMQILYDAVNRRKDLLMERVFEPAKDMAAKMREHGIPLFTLESKTPVRDMDVLGFTLQYEMSYTDVLDMLSLSGIPFYSNERNEDHPLVIAGGPCAFNPEPLSDYIDAFLIGDGEEALPGFLSSYADLKSKGLSRKEILIELSKLEGVYVPSLYQPLYDEEGKFTGYKKLEEDAPDTVKRTIIPDIDSVPFPTKMIVPNIEAVHDRACVESFRGCTRGCRFCQAGMIYRPVRERSKDNVKRLAVEQIKETGHDELSLLSLSTSDHSDFEDMATELMHECSDMNVSLSLPSLRLDSFSFSVLNEIQKYKKSGLTFAVEAGSERLRDSINKGITEDDIYNAVRQAIGLGWRHVKLYFMIGLPGETYEDLLGIPEIAKNIMDIAKEEGAKGRFNVTVSCSNFVPKPFTPFQWCPQDTCASLQEKREFLREKLKIKGVRFSCHDAFVSKVESVLAKGDRRTGGLLMAAYKNGALLDGWSEHFDKDAWEKAFDEWEVSFSSISEQELSHEDHLPWDIIDPCVTKDFLIKEHDRSKECVKSHDCREGCLGCGINKVVKCFAGVKE